jgi:acyl-CoA dehydrogenase
VRYPEHRGVLAGEGIISETVGRIIDRAVQLAGGMGVTEDSVIGRIYADIRAFRINDGPSEAHRAAIARKPSPG